MIRFNLKNLLSAVLGVIAFQGVQAQLSVDVSLTPEQMVQNLVGTGVQISNVTVTACDSSYGYYQSAGTEIGTSQGLLLTTGKALYAIGPNNSIGNCSTSAGTCDYFDNDCPGSALLNQAQDRTTFDATQFEFDIIPQGDSLKFKYTFASEEYNEWVGSQFNDVFGFYISGPGIGTDVNVALIPTTGQVVSINTINALTNQAFYYNNQNPLGQFVQYDGFTRNLVAKVGGLFPCETYHLKLVIADGTDHVYDSGVFIQSIESNPVLVSTATSNGLDYMVEGCSDGSITFTRQIIDDQPAEVLYWVGGTATNGVDYTPTIGNGIPFAQNSVIIPPNQGSVTFNITPTNDDLLEGPEYITIYLANPLCLESGSADSINFYINDLLNVQITTDEPNTCVGNCVTLTGIVPDLPTTTFNWSANVTGGDELIVQVCPTQATTYSLDATIGECNGSAEITINVSSIAVELTATPVSCDGGANGTISVNVRDAIEPYTYSWSGPDGFTSNADSLSGVAAGEYCVTVTDAAGCVNTACVDVIESNELTASSSLSDFACNQISCNGSCDGSISMTVTGGVQPYSFSWIGPEGFLADAEDISSLCAGTYELTLTDATGCEYTNSYTLTEPSIVDIAVVGSVDLECSGVETGEASVGATGGCAPYTYSWSHSASVTGPVATNLGSGTYEVSVTDQNGCNSAGSVTIVINEPIDPLQVIIDEISLYPGGYNVSCPGSADGYVNVTSSAGTTPYTFEWTNSTTGEIVSNVEDLSGVACGAYSLTVSDGNDCTVTEEVVLECVPAIDVVLDVQNNPCGSPTASLGGIEVTSVSGGQGAPYTFSWSGPSCSPCTTQDITNLDSGDYILIVTDALGCTDETTATIGQNDAFVATGDVTAESCPDLCDGSIDINITDGTGGGGGGVTPFPLSASSNIQICFTATHTYVSDLAFHLVGPPSCGSPDILLSPLPGGSCNSGNNIVDLCFSNNNTNPLAVCGAPVPLSGVYGAYADGTAIDWTPILGCDANSPGWAVQIYDCVSIDVGALTDATLTFTDVDGSGNAISASYSTPVGFNSPINDNSCSSATASIFQVETTGGGGSGGGGGGGGNPVEGDFTFTWSGPFNGVPPSTQDVFGLCPGDYSVLISNGDCEETLFFTVPEADPIIVDVVAQINPTCFGQNNGSIDISVIGGSGNFSYQWIPQPACFFFGATTQDVNNLPACSYTVSITDQVTGCNVLETITLDAPQVMELTVVTSQFEGGYNLSCHNSNDGAISVFVTGGTPDPTAFAPFDYLYDWINDCSDIDPALYGNDPNAPNATNLPGGSYGINVTDANGCLATTCFDLIPPDSIQSPAIIQNISCQSDEGCITPNVQGGSSTFIAYEWTGNIGANAPDASTLCGLAAGAFTLTVTDSNGCQETFDYEITDVSSPEAVIESTTAASCFNICDGTATVSVDGGEAPYSVLIDGVAAAAVLPGVIDGICQGAHDITIIDANGCESTASIVIDSPDELVVTTEILIQDPDQLFSIQCSGEATGSVNGTVSGGSLPYDISWTDASGTIISLSEDLSSLAAGQYCLNVIDGDACLVQSCVLLTEPELPLVVTSEISQFDAQYNLACFNSTDGFIDLTVSGGVPPYTFEWQGDNVIDGAEDQSSLGAGVYDVVVIDANSCQISLSFELLAPPPISSGAELTAISCSGECDAAITTNVTGVNDGYTLSWSGPNGFSSTDANIAGLCPGDYVLTVVDPVSGCSLEETTSIVDPGVLAVTIALSGDCGLGTVGACAVVTGGTAPYSFDWSNGGVLDCVNVTTSGALDVTVTDANNCPAAVATVNVDVPDAPFSISGVDTDASCGACNGSIDITVNGGSAGYVFQWANGEQTEDLSNLCAGLYAISVTDALGCTDELSFNIAQSTGLVIDLAITNALCAGDSTGSVNVTTNGGTPEFTYSWTDANENVIGVESSIANLPSGSYNVSVSDAAGCDTTATFSITAPQELSVTITLSEYSIANNPYNISTPGGNNGSILVEVENGTPEYTYNWTPNTIEADENNPSSLIAGEYNLQIVDANGCVLDTLITLVDPDELKLYTALSPNGDSFNDTYVIDGVQDCPNNQFKVFNRWGNLVYEKDSYLNDWYGQDKDGNTLSDGTYFVIFEGCGAKFNTYVDLRRN
jgi:gliding motility-associated-like protein